jgi:hypothetical protein
MVHVGHAREIEIIAIGKQGNKAANCSRLYVMLGFAYIHMHTTFLKESYRTKSNKSCNLL